jgi:hypothetical protein
VPYKGSTGARNDILGGQVQMMFDTIPTMNPTVEAGLVRALGTSGERRSPILHDIPTISEAGVPGFVASGWVGIVAPAATPEPIVDLLNTEINKILNSREIKDGWTAGRRPDVDDLRRIRRLHQSRNREMGEGRPGRRREDQLIRAGRVQPRISSERSGVGA